MPWPKVRVLLADSVGLDSALTNLLFVVLDDLHDLFIQPHDMTAAFV